MNKRNFIKAAGVATVAAPMALSETFAAQKAKRVKLPKYKNEDFYENGKFLPEKGKQAYYELMAAHGYPITENLRANIWATDFGLGDFLGAGMGGVFWINLQEYGYFAHEIYLFPGQMIVEHSHVPTAKGKAKMETWHVRHGSIYTLGEEGEPLPEGFKLPKSQDNFITVKKHYVMKPGEIRTLNRLEAKHFMMGGPEGAIVSEYASFHDNDGLRFTNPGVKF